MLNTEKSLDQIVALCKGRGFVYPGSEIYGGLANRSVLNSKQTSNRLGEKNSSRKINIM